jgi:hypothetical protein
MNDSPEERLSQRFEPGHACVIGVGGDLPNTVGDAAGLAKVLQDPERCAYPTHQVHLLTSTVATRSHIIATLETLANTTNHESTVLIYFSGHGYQVTKPIKSYYLMPYGYNPEDLSETALSGSEFIELLRDIPAQKLLVILDCCHAGGLSDVSGFQVAKAPLPPEAQRMFARGGGRMMIGSSKPDELSYAGEPYSAFTYALLKGLCGAGAVKQDGYVRATDLAMYASQVVPTLTNDQQYWILRRRIILSWPIMQADSCSRRACRENWRSHPELSPNRVSSMVRGFKRRMLWHRAIGRLQSVEMSMVAPLSQAIAT